MTLFDKCLPVILEHEGGYVNDPVDPGGATKYGISFKFLKGLPSEFGDIDGDGDIDIDDIKALTTSKAAKLYYTFFWRRMNLDSVSQEVLALHMFDMGVNAGTKTAIKLLQRILGVTIDGILGKETLGAITQTNSTRIINDYIKARYSYYDAIIKKNPALGKYKKGWYRRVTSTKFIGQ